MPKHGSIPKLFSIIIFYNPAIARYDPSYYFKRFFAQGGVSFAGDIMILYSSADAMQLHGYACESPSHTGSFE